VEDRQHRHADGKRHELRDRLQPDRLVMRALWLCLVLATSAHAGIIHMSSFDIVDDQSSNTDLLPTDWITTLANGATDGDLDASTTQKHIASSGGTDTSARSLFVGPESGETAYISLPSGITMSSTLASAHMALNVGALPSGERTVFEFREGAALGCNYRVQSDGKIKAFYGSELQATSVNALYLKHCAPAGGVNYSWIGCAVNADCRPTAQTCTAGTRYWAELEFRQVSAPGSTNRVACDLIWHGRPEWTTTYDDTPYQVPGAVTDVRIGAPGSEAVALDAYVDDVVVSTDATVGHGYVGFLKPDANGIGTNNWLVETCGASATYWQCEDDYASGGVLDSSQTDTLKTGKVNKAATIALSETVAAELLGLTIPAVEWYVVARTTDNNGTSDLRARAQVCPSGVCTPLASVDLTLTYPQLTPIVMLRGVEPAAPSGPWSGATADELELIASTLTTPPATNILRLSALGAYYFARKSDLEEERNLQDHDEGADDGKITVTFIGDSLATGTAAVGCSQDPTDLCNQETYCSWDAKELGFFEDIPTGGCTSDTQCRTCVSKRASLNAGAGAPCTSNAQCPQAAGNPVGVVATCNTSEGECNDNPAIPCAADADCAGWGASCDTTATCNDACPGTNNTCPAASTYGSWAKTIAGKINVDNIIVCGLGGERLYGMATNRWAGILAGTDGNCVHVQKCATCAITDDPDYVVVLEGANDLTDFRPAPTCAESTAVSPAVNVVGGYTRNHTLGFCYDNCTAGQRDIQCVADADCASISADSKCVGALNVNETSANGYACLKDGTEAGVLRECSIRSFLVSDEISTYAGCDENADCPGGTCTITDTAQRSYGFCNCDGNADCAAGFQCVGARCRRTCTTDSSCTTTTRSGACKDQGGGVKVCAGRCTCPCNARSCSTDQDCASGTIRTAGDFWKWEPRGKCSAGKCTECGPDICASAGYPYAYAHTMDSLSATSYAGVFSWMKEQLAALSDSGDGRPVLLAVRHPWYPAEVFGGACGELGDLYADAGKLRRGSAMLASRDIREVDAIRTIFEKNRNVGLWSDYVHFSVVGANLISSEIAAYMGTLGTCATTGTNQPQRYCKNVVTDAYSATTCADASVCAARETCSLRVCTSGTDCPAGTDECRAE
jgi:hypothetical protein